MPKTGNLWPRMILSVDGSESIMVHMRIDLCGRYVHMPQHLLNRPQIRTAAQQVRGKTMTQRMGRKASGHTRPNRILSNQTPDLNTA